MNPIVQWIVAHSTGRALLRRCPKCRNVEKVRADQGQDSVPCSRCGTPIPPAARL